MSVDRLQEKIRKLKNPTVIDLTLRPEEIPQFLLEEEGNLCGAYSRYCQALLDGLKDIVPAVRFGFGAFALQGAAGLDALENALKAAKNNGFYVILDAPEAMSLQNAEYGASVLLDPDCQWCFDGLVLTAYIGSDALRPYADAMAGSDKALFAVLRTANRSAPELQDLLTGSRLVHIAAADVVNRLAEPRIGKCGYSAIGGVAGASSAHSLRTLRQKYNRLFLLLDGYDYSNSNAKNCSEAFDRLGHGAAACAGQSVTAAYLAEEADAGEYVACAQRAAERMRKNLTRYVTVL